MERQLDKLLKISHFGEISHPTRRHIFSQSLPWTQQVWEKPVNQNYWAVREVSWVLQLQCNAPVSCESTVTENWRATYSAECWFLLPEYSVPQKLPVNHDYDHVFLLVSCTHFTIFTWASTMLLPTLNLFTLVLYFYLLLVILGTKDWNTATVENSAEPVVLKCTV